MTCQSPIGGIIALLQIDGRMPFSSIAAQLHVSVATAQRRTQQLIDEGYFKIIGVVNPGPGRDTDRTAHHQHHQ